MTTPTLTPGDRWRLVPAKKNGRRFDGLQVVCMIHILNSKDLIKLLEKAGWQHVRTAGSHHQLKHPEKPLVITVPHPKKDLPIGTVNGILKAAGLK